MRVLVLILGGGAMFVGLVLGLCRVGMGVRLGRGSGGLRNEFGGNWRRGSGRGLWRCIVLGDFRIVFLLRRILIHLGGSIRHR